MQRTGRNKAVEPKAEAKEVVSATENGTTRNVLPADGPYRLVERLAKRIARSGLCSRREAERLIEEGLVSVDGAIVKTPAINVTPASVVMINNKKLEKTPPPQVWLHYKKRGVLVTHHDPQGREALFPHLRNMGLPHLVSVGRLDYTSEGLLLLTNNGRLAQYLEHPSNEYERKYKVRIRGKVEQKVIDRLAKGITVGGVEYGPIKVTPIEKRRSEEETSTNEWVYVSLTEGKNREIRRVFEHFKLVVTRLIRVQYGPYTLDKKLEPGDVVETRLRLDLVKKADRYWWLWDGDKESSTVPFPESYFRIDPRKIITSLPTPASSAKPPSVPALDSPPSSTSQE